MAHTHRRITAQAEHTVATNSPLSARGVQDAVWMPVLLALWMVNYRVYGSTSRSPQKNLECEAQ